MSGKRRNKSNKTIIILAIIVAIFAAIWFFTGFYVIPSIPGIEKGGTYWFFRTGTQYPFFSSPYSLLKKSTSLFNAFDQTKLILQFPKKKVIARFSYSEYLYDLSKGRDK